MLRVKITNLSNGWKSSYALKDQIQKQGIHLFLITLSRSCTLMAGASFCGRQTLKPGYQVQRWEVNESPGHQVWKWTFIFLGHRSPSVLEALLFVIWPHSFTAVILSVPSYHVFKNVAVEFKELRLIQPLYRLSYSAIFLSTTLLTIHF